MAAPESRAVLERVVEVLRGVKDPELDRDVVQLGFVKNMKFENGDLSFDIERDRPTINVLRERLRDECLKAVADAKIDGVLGVFVNVAVKVSTEKAAPKFLRTFSITWTKSTKTKTTSKTKAPSPSKSFRTKSNSYKNSA